MLEDRTIAGGKDSQQLVPEKAESAGIAVL